MSRFSLALLLAKRFSSGKHDNTFIRFISKSSTLGICLGVAVLIIALSVMNGFKHELVNRLLAVVPHVELIAVDRPIEFTEKKLSLVEEHPEVIGVAPVIKATGMLQKSELLKAVEIRGVIPSHEFTVSDIDNYMQSGEFVSLTPSSHHIILGELLAKALNVSIGSDIELLLPNQSSQLKIMAPKLVSFKVSGIFRLGGQLDANLAYIHLDDARPILGLKGNEVSGFRLKINDVFSAPTVAREVGMMLNDYVYLMHWLRTHGHLYQDIQLVQVIMYIVLTLVICVACFNIVSTLVMTVKEKQGEIAILKTMGIKDRTIVHTFMLIGFFNALVGIAFGILLGLLIVLNLTSIVSYIEGLKGTTFLQQDVYFIDFIPVVIAVSDVIIVPCIALVIALLATIYPAKTATNADPASVLGQ